MDTSTFATIFLLLLTDATKPPHMGAPLGGFSDPAACTRAASAMGEAQHSSGPRAIYFCEQVQVALKQPRTSTQVPRWAAAGYGDLATP
jgi:hypothetical protein